MSPRPSVSSMVVTSKPSIAACNALMGSTSVMTTRAPMPRSEWEQPLPTSPYPQTTATLPATITSVARLMPSASDSRQPYKLSNFDLVTRSEERRVGKECRSRWAPFNLKKKIQTEPQDGKSTADAIFEACMLPFRPLLLLFFFKQKTAYEMPK